MSGYILAIDQGTTSSRAIVFDGDMRIAYENSYATCSMLASCDFVNCFPY